MAVGDSRDVSKAASSLRAGETLKLRKVGSQ